MKKDVFVREEQLASLAKEFRSKAGKNRAEAARELGVARPTVHLAEENPKAALLKVRKRLIEQYSPYRIDGPFYVLVEK